jgi:single-strand DNA-binding protein
VPRTTNGGKSQSSFRVAVQRQFANAQGVREADFFNVTCWGKTADFVNSYLIKGRKVALTGSIQNRSYEAQDGSKRYVTEIIAQTVEAVTSPREDDSRPVYAPNAAPQPSQQQRMDYSGGFTQVDDPELPFL